MQVSQRIQNSTLPTSKQVSSFRFTEVFVKVTLTFHADNIKLQNSSITNQQTLKKKES